jgi:hypothetical protein
MADYADLSTEEVPQERATRRQIFSDHLSRHNAGAQVIATNLNNEPDHITLPGSGQNQPSLPTAPVSEDTRNTNTLVAPPKPGQLLLDGMPEDFTAKTAEFDKFLGRKPHSGAGDIENTHITNLQGQGPISDRDRLNPGKPESFPPSNKEVTYDAPGYAAMDTHITNLQDDGPPPSDSLNPGSRTWRDNPVLAQTATPRVTSRSGTPEERAANAEDFDLPQSLATSVLNTVAGIHRHVGSINEHAKVDADRDAAIDTEAAARGYVKSDFGAPKVLKPLPRQLQRTAADSKRPAMNPTSLSSYNMGGMSKTAIEHNKRVATIFAPFHSKAEASHKKITEKWNTLLPDISDTPDTAVAGNEQWTPVTHGQALARMTAAENAVHQAHLDGHIDEITHDNHMQTLGNLRTSLFGTAFGPAETSRNPTGAVSHFRDEHEGQLVLPGMETEVKTEPKKKTRTPADPLSVTQDIFGSHGRELPPLVNPKVVNIDSGDDDASQPLVPLRANVAEMASAFGRGNLSQQGVSRYKAERRGVPEGEVVDRDEVLPQSRLDVESTLNAKAGKAALAATTSAEGRVRGSARQVAKNAGEFGGVIHLHKNGDDWHTMVRFPGSDAETQYADSRSSAKWGNSDVVRRQKERDEGVDENVRQSWEQEHEDMGNAKVFKMHHIADQHILDEGHSGSLSDYIQDEGSRRDYALSVIHHPLGSMVVDSRAANNPVLAFAPKKGQNPSGEEIHAAANEALNLSSSPVKVDTQEDREASMQSVESNKTFLNKYWGKNYGGTPHEISNFTLPEVRNALTALGVQQGIEKHHHDSMDAMTNLELTGALHQLAQQTESAQRNLGPGMVHPSEVGNILGQEDPDTLSRRTSNAHLYGQQTNLAGVTQKTAHDWNYDENGMVTGRTATKQIVGPEALASNRDPKTDPIRSKFTASEAFPSGRPAPQIPIDLPGAHVLDYIIKHVANAQRSAAEGAKMSSLGGALGAGTDDTTEAPKAPGVRTKKVVTSTVLDADGQPVTDANTGETRTRKVEKPVAVPLSERESKQYAGAVNDPQYQGGRTGTYTEPVVGYQDTEEGQEAKKAAEQAESDKASALAGVRQAEGIKQGARAGTVTKTSGASRVADIVGVKPKGERKRGRKGKPTAEPTAEPTA